MFVCIQQITLILIFCYKSTNQLKMQHLNIYCEFDTTYRLSQDFMTELYSEHDGHT